MKGFAAGEGIGRVCEKERTFLAETCDRGLASMGRLTFAGLPMWILSKQLRFEECAIASGMGCSQQLSAIRFRIDRAARIQYFPLKAAAGDGRTHHFALRDP